MSTQEPKKSSPSQGTPSATGSMSEEELEEYVLKAKFEMSSMDNAMANSNYTGICRLGYFGSPSTQDKFYLVLMHAFNMYRVFD